MNKLLELILLNKIKNSGSGSGSSDYNVKAGAYNINSSGSFTGKITEIKSFDVANNNLLNECFMNLYGLVKAPQLLNCGNVVTIEKLFYGCNSLVDVPVYNFPNVTNPSNAFGGCSMLSNESLNNILATCIGMTKTLSTYKNLKKIGLTSAQASICEGLSNYDSFIEAGWTTGY